MKENSQSGSGSLLRRLMQLSNSARWMTIVILLTITFTLWEITHRDSDAERESMRLNIDYLDGLNLSDTIAELYPERGDTHIRKAIQAGECFNRFRAFRDDPNKLVPDACRKYYSQPIIDVIQAHFKKGLATGVKNDEKLYYQHLLFLIQIGADKPEIDKAYQDWLRLFPLSREKDPFTNKPRTR